MYLWQKLLIAGLSVLLLIAIIFGVIQYRTVEERDMTIKNLQRDLQLALAIAPESTISIFRVAAPVRSGTLFDPSVIEVVQIPESLKSDAFITDPELLRGAIWRLNLETHGLITYDMMAFEPIFPSDRFHVAMVQAVTPSLEVGDFVDVRMITPDGIDFIVMPKKRVVNMYDSGIELIMSETEWMIYTGALIDRFMHRGTVIYASKYVDPALQPRLYSTYIPPREIVDYMNINRNMLFPYRDGTDVEGLRAFIESTQPWNRYASTLYTSAVQAIRDRQDNISSALASQVGAMNQARSEFVQYMIQYYESQGLTWEGGSVQQTQVNTTGVASNSPSTSSGTSDNVSSTNADGTWVDANGTLRRPDGTPVVQSTDIVGWGSEGLEEAEVIYQGQGEDFQIDVPSLNSN